MTYPLRFARDSPAQITWQNKFKHLRRIARRFNYALSEGVPHSFYITHPYTIKGRRNPLFDTTARVVFVVAVGSDTQQPLRFHYTLMQHGFQSLDHAAYYDHTVRSLENCYETGHNEAALFSFAKEKYSAQFALKKLNNDSPK